jgi:uncharacterized protein YjbI with pentapeptide repeats
MDNKEEETELLTNFTSVGLNTMSEKERTELLIDYIQYVEDNRESEGSVTIWCPGNMIDISNELSDGVDTFEVSISPKFGDIALVKNSEGQYSLTDDSVFYEAVELSEYIFSDEYKKDRVQHILDNETWVEDVEIPSDIQGEDRDAWILERHEEETGESFESAQAELIDEKVHDIECDVESWLSFESLSDLRETLDKYQALEGKENVSGMDFSYMDLSGMDLSGKDLSGCKFTKADMTGSILVNSNLSGAELDYATLDGAQMQRTNLDSAKLYRASMVEVNLEGAFMSGASLVGADLKSSFIREANLIDADLENACFEGSNLLVCDLTNSKLENCNLNDTVLREANLTGASLKNSELQGSDLEDANLTKANFEGAKLYGANMKGVSIVETNFKDVKGFKPPKPTKTKKRVSEDDCSFG